MSTQTSLITAEQFAEMHFDVPVELVRGEIVYLYGEDGMTRPGWPHGVACMNVGAELRNWCRRAKAGLVVGNDAGVITERRPDTVRGPDVFFVAADRIRPGISLEGYPDIVPNLCVEVWSPSDRWREVHHKIDEYFARGVEEVWVVNPQSRTVEVFRPEEPPRMLREEEQIESRELPEFNCPVAVFFEGI